MVSRNEEDWNLPNGMFPNGTRQFFPKIRRGLRIIEDVSGTQDGMYSIATSHIEDASDDVHTGPRKLLLGLVRKGRESTSKMPIRSVQHLQHDVP